MSNTEDHNKKLKDLLRRTPLEKQEDAGEFEQDAREGFALLESEADALDLKNSLDARIFKEVFSAKKQDSRKLYWLVAATLIGVIGFSIYLFQTYFGVRDSNLAIQSTSIHEPKEKQQSTLTAPIEDSNTSQSKEEIATIAANKNNVNKKDPITFQSTESPNTLPTDKTEVMISSKADKAEIKAGGEKEEAVAMLEESNQVFENRDDQKAIDAVTEDATSVETESKSRVKQSESKKAKRSENEISAPQAAPSSVAEIKAISAGYALPKGVNYKGGELQLQKDLREKLVSHKLLQKFDAILSLNKNFHVEKVKLTNSYSLSTAEQKKLIEVLKTLDNFSVTVTPDKTKLPEYRIEFRP